MDEAGRLTGPFNAMLVNPAVGDALQQLGAAIRYRTALPARVREVAILVVAAYRRSDFEWHAHAPLAREAGLNDEDLAAIRRCQDPGGPATPEPPVLASDDYLVRRVVQALLVQRDLDDTLFALVTGKFGVACVVELITLVGYYDLLALSMRACRVELPVGVGPVF